MSKSQYKKEKTARRGKAMFLAAAVLLIAVSVLSIACGMFSRTDRGSDPSVNGHIDTKLDVPRSDYMEEISNHETIVFDEPAKFPLVLEDGQVRIETLFRYDGINPDCGDQQGSNTAAIEVQNLSDAHLLKAAITMESSDGETLHFVATELPAGKAAIVFSAENAVSRVDTTYGNVGIEASFDANVSIKEDEISVSVEGTHITLRNNTDAEMKEVVVYCRSVLGDQYFGGVTYSYSVNHLPAQGTVAFDAVDCILGAAEVVRIEINKA